MRLPTTDIIRNPRQRLTISQHFNDDAAKPYAILEWVPHVGRSGKFRIELSTVEEVRRLHNWLGSHLLYLIPTRNLAHSAAVATDEAAF